MSTAIERPKADEILAPVSEQEGARPLVPYIVHDDAGRPVLGGSQCGECNEILIGSPQVCVRCGARGGMTPLALGQTGKLYNWTTVHRCLPGVPVPFVFAIVDLDGGGTVKGNLIAEDADIAYDMPVKLVFEIPERTDSKGRSYLSYHFVKA